MKNLFPVLETTTTQLVNAFSLIPEERKTILKQLTDFIKSRVENKNEIFLNFICTHNSRRSHIAQLWAQAASYYYNIPDVYCFSGGTEATAFNPRAVKAVQDVGFKVEIIKPGDNPLYAVGFADEAEPLSIFSKKYDDPFNPVRDFAAIMTCSHADENCPLVLGASARIALTYNDPKDFDGTAMETDKYKERVHEIGREILFAFSKVKP